MLKIVRILLVNIVLSTSARKMKQYKVVLMSWVHKNQDFAAKMAYILIKLFPIVLIISIKLY